jgi:putrescine transport system ATP-binding protein
LQQRIGLTFVIVTHDQEEAMTLADRIGVMNAGRLVQVGTPTEIYEQPNSAWVADFIGHVNLIEGRVVSSGLGHTMIDTAAGKRLLVMDRADTAAGTGVVVAVRPEKMHIDTAAPLGSAENCFAGRVAEVGYLGGSSIYKVKLDSGDEMKVQVINRAPKAERSIEVGSQVWLTFAPEAGVVLSQ